MTNFEIITESPEKFAKFLRRESTMTNFYRFPKMAEIDLWAQCEQVEKLREEVEEVANVASREKDRIAYGVELMDLIHAAETALRMQFDDDEVDALALLCESKNRKRGYYDD